MSLPTQREVILNAIAALETVNNGLSEAQNWLHAEWCPAGSSLPPAVAEARTATLRTIGDYTIGIATAKRSLYDALEVLGAHSAGRNGSPVSETDGDAATE